MASHSFTHSHKPVVGCCHAKSYWAPLEVIQTQGHSQKGAEVELPPELQSHHNHSQYNQNNKYIKNRNSNTEGSHLQLVASLRQYVLGNDCCNLQCKHWMLQCYTLDNTRAQHKKKHLALISDHLILNWSDVGAFSVLIAFVVSSFRWRGGASVWHSSSVVVVLSVTARRRYSQCHCCCCQDQQTHPQQL